MITCALFSFITCNKSSSFLSLFIHNTFFLDSIHCALSLQDDDAQHTFGNMIVINQPKISVSGMRYVEKVCYIGFNVICLFTCLRVYIYPGLFWFI